MRAAVDGVDVVGEAENGFRVAVVVLQANLHGHAAALGFHVDGLIVQHLLAAVQMLDELGDAAVVLELGALGLAGLRVGGALVGERDHQTLVQESQLAQALRQCVVVVFRRGEDGFVGHEVNFGSVILGGSGLFQLAGGVAFRVRLLPGESVAPDFEIEFFAKRVHAGDADAVQSAGNFVRVAVEFSAGVQRGHHHLRGGNFFAVDVHRVDGNAAAVVDHGDGIVDVNGDFDLVGVTRERLVDGVVDDFIHQMMQPEFAGRADVHRGTFAHRFHAAQNFDGVRGVVAVTPVNRRGGCVFCFSFSYGRVDFFGRHSAP